MNESPYLVEQNSYSQYSFPHGAGPGWYGSSVNPAARKPLPPQDQFWKCFIEIYHHVCDNAKPVPPSLTLRTDLPVISQGDAALAEELFLQEASKACRSKSLWGRSQKIIEGKTYSIATAALIRLVQEGGRPGAAYALVRRGGTIILSKDPQKQAQQISDRHELVKLAATLQHDGLVEYFATISPPERLAEAFAIAFHMRNLDLVRVLLERGASVDSLLQSVPNHFESLDVPMLSLLLRSPNPCSVSTRDRWLYSAVAQGKMEMVIMLLRYGSSDNLDYEKILTKALEELHLESYLIALKTMRGSDNMHFSGLLQQIVNAVDMPVTDRVTAMEATLCTANSKEARAFRHHRRVAFLFDQDASEALQICAASGQTQLLDLLRDPRFNTSLLPTTLASAIQACDLRLLDHLYPRGCSVTLPIDFSLLKFPKVADDMLHDKLLRRLLELQVPGSYLDDELVYAIMKQNSAMIKLLLNAGASVDANGAKSLSIAVESRNIRLLQVLLPRSSKKTRNTVFAQVQSLEKLPKRLMTKLFAEKGLSRDVLRSGLRDAVCASKDQRDEILIDIFVAAGGDYNYVEASSAHGLIELGDSRSIVDLLERLSKYKEDATFMSDFASQLMEHLMQLPTNQIDYHVRCEIFKSLIKNGAIGNGFLTAFEEFLVHDPVTDEDLLCLFISPLAHFRSPSHNALVARALSVVDTWILYRLIERIELHDEALQLTLERAADSALNDDARTAERVSCYLIRAKSNSPVVEQALEFHARTYAQKHLPSQAWPLKTITALTSKGFAGTVWLTHTLMAITEGENPEVLAMVLESARAVCTEDTIDSVLALAVQTNNGCSLEIVKTLLSFGASENGLNITLVMAAEIDNIQLCNTLLESGADVNYQEGESLISALKRDRHAIFECLLAAKKANTSALARAWNFTASETALEYGQLLDNKVMYCDTLLQAGFTGPEVHECLLGAISLVEPDYDMIETILQQSETIKEDKRVFEAQNSESPENSGSADWKSSPLMVALDRVVETGNGRLCRLILTHLPPVFSIPIDILIKAATTGTAILSLLLDHLPHSEKQPALDTCLVQAATFATDAGTCTYLLCEGASCELPPYEAMAAATKRALLHNNSDRAALETLLSSILNQDALEIAWNIVLSYLNADDDEQIPEFGQLRAIKVLQLLLLSGFRDLKAAENCLYTLCNRNRSCVSKCEACLLEPRPKEEDCCPFQRIQTKMEALVRSLLDLGLSTEDKCGQSILMAANHYQHEILEILLTSVKNVGTSLSRWFNDWSQFYVFFRNSSHSVEQKQARMKTMELILRHGTSPLSLRDCLVSAIQESVDNPEARETAELLLQYGVYDESGVALKVLATNFHRDNRSLLALVLEQEPSEEARLDVAEKLVASVELDDESTSALLLSALCGSSSDITIRQRDRSQNLLRAAVNSNKNETLTLILSSISEKSFLTPFADHSSFLGWILRSQIEVTECMFTVVLDWFGPEDIAKIDGEGENLCLVQEAVLGGQLQLIPLLVSCGAVTTKGDESLLLYTLQNTDGEQQALIEAVRSLSNESTWDDGSLHLAITSMREKVVNVLLEQGHDPNFGIPFEDLSKDAKLPLNLLCATASVTAYESECGLKFRNIMNNLIIHGADISAQMCGRSPLFNALDNPRCNVGLLSILVECLQFSEELERSLAEADAGNASGHCADPSIRRDSGMYIDVEEEQENPKKVTPALANSNTTEKTAVERYLSRFMCPVRGCNITRQKISSLRRHYLKMHPDPKPHFRAKDIKRVKWVADEKRENAAAKIESKGGHFVEDVQGVRTSFFEYEDEKHHYSATMYLGLNMRGPSYFEPTKFSPQKKAALLRYLRTQDLPDLYYALEGPQPEGAVGVPLEILLSSTECAVCGDTATDINNVFGNLSETCTHNWTSIMCRDCLDGYMTSKITVDHGAVNSKISCWAEGCKSILSHAEIQTFSDPKLFEAYDFALLQQTIHEGETFAECSTANCNGGGWLESEDVSYFQCQWCGLETCVSHNGPRSDHAGKPCPATPEGQRYAEEEAREEAERKAAAAAKTKADAAAKKKAKAEADKRAKEKKEGLKATEALMKQISKKCPTCKVPIEKSVGCDHMTCRTTSGRAGCGAEFCFQCLTLYVDIRRDGNSAHKESCPHYRRNTYLH